MRAIRIEQWCTPDALRVVDVSMPQCSREQVLIQVRAVPVTFSLWLLIQGKYQRKPTLPFIPGSFVAGEVVECGKDATRFRPGNRVIAALDTGGCAEYVAAPQLNTYAIPDALPFDRANALNTAYSATLAALTWPHMLGITSGQQLLVLGAAGGVGTAALEIGGILGATVIAAASTAPKRAWASRHGATHVVEAEPSTLRDRVMAVTGGDGVDAVLDPVGGALFNEALRCLKPEGRLATVGFASGEIPNIPANLLLVKNIVVCGLNMNHYKVSAGKRHESRVRALFETLGHWYEEGRIDPAIAARFPLEQAPKAFATVLDRGHLGHVALIP